MARFIAPETFHAFDERGKIFDIQEKGLENTINQRVAEALLRIDPMEMIMRQYHGIFSESFERPEERLNEQGKLGMMMWGYQQKSDPYFKHMTQWILDTQGNNTVRKAKNDHEWFFGRASIVNVEAFIKEVGRLSNLYEELLDKNKLEFNSDVTVE